MRTSEYAKLLSTDDGLLRWSENLRRGSPITAEVYLRRLGAFCKDSNLTPRQLAEKDRREIENLLQDHLASLERLGRAPGYLASIMKAVRSWAEWNEKPLQRKIKIANRDATPTLEGEVVPTRQELKHVLYGYKTPLRTRACISLVAFSGLRLETLGDYYGKDGLKVRDLPELQFTENVGFGNTPTVVRVRADLSKAGHQYFTFLAEEGCRIIAELLERRKQAGEKLTPETPVIGTSPFYDMRGRFRREPEETRHIRTSKIGEHMREAIRACNFPWRPYIFRSYFDTALMLAESKRIVSHAYQQFWMGHKGDIESRYTTRKQRLPEEVVEDMRGAYLRAEEYMTTTREPMSEERLKRAFQEGLLLLAGFRQEEIDKMNLDELSNEELQRIAREKFHGVMANNGSKQKVVEIREVEKHLQDGWEFVSPLGSDRAILRVPY